MQVLDLILSWQIEPIRTGYRWVLAYNFVDQSQAPSRSASALDLPIQNFTQTLARWQDLKNSPLYLAYPLDHQYTNRHLKLSHLKGDDLYRARHIARSCAAHGLFHVFLGNMEMCITDPNNEEEEEEVSVLSLCRVVSPAGFDLTIHDTLDLSTTNLSRGASYEDRRPDVPRGGNYVGNQYTEIDQFFKDSVLVMVPSNHMVDFLLGGSKYTHYTLNRLMEKLRGFIEKTGDSSLRGLLLQTCQTVLSQRYANDKERDLCLGPVAVGAAFLKESNLFGTTTREVKGSFENEYYSALGKLSCFEELIVEKDDLETAITKCGKIHQIYDNLKAFRDGFLKQGANRSDQLRVNTLKRWLILCCTAVFATRRITTSKTRLHSSAKSLTVKTRRSVNCVRSFINWFYDKYDKALSSSALVVELLLHLNTQARSKDYLQVLLDAIVEPTIAKFDLCQHAGYNQSQFPHGHRAIPGGLDKRKINVNSNKTAGPIKELYECASAGKKDTLTLFPQKILSSAPGLTVGQSNQFLISLAQEIIPIADCSSSEVQQCLRSLISLHITRTVRQEPRRPSDWARLEETNSCPGKCQQCWEMNTFLQSPDVSYYAFNPNMSHVIYHLQPYFNNLKYFDVKGPSYSPEGVTKTLKWWEEQHPLWEKRCSDVLKALRDIPEAKLKECLGQTYEEVMELRMVKIGADESYENNDEGKEAFGLRSNVPLKRARGDS
ncbi:MAG: hypothetical protein Q9169_005479 [Polycauliona sp. 2 TL-2023]